MNARRPQFAALALVAALGLSLFAGCAAPDESDTAEQTEQTEQKMIAGPGTSYGCSNREIRAAQRDCSSMMCRNGGQRSNGIHSCVHQGGTDAFTFVCACSGGPVWGYGEL
jgi:hypothetical protein